MRRVFTHLRLPTGPSIHGEKRFFRKPGLSHFGRDEQQSKTTKVLSQQARGSRETLLFFLLLFFALLFFSFLFFRARDLSRLMRPLSDCAIHTCSHDLARPRRTLQDPKHARAKSAKKIKKIKQIEKNERKALWTLAVTSQCRI